MNFDEKIIVHGFAIAADTNEGLAGAYSGNGDYFVYYDSQGGAWGDIHSAQITNNEYQLVKILEDAERNSKQSETAVRGYKPFPIIITTTIESLNSQKFDDYVIQLKREQALKKLNDEDMVVLGLKGTDKK